MTTTISTPAPHPLLRSSRGRVLWPERVQPAETKTISTSNKRGSASRDHDDDDGARSVRQRTRTSSITSIETIRPSIVAATKPRKSLPEALTRPEAAPPSKDTIPPSSLTIKSKSNSRKRVHSIDDEASDSVIPRIRQRLMSSAKTDSTGADPQATVKRKISPATSVALNKLREKLVRATEEWKSGDRPLPVLPEPVLAPVGFPSKAAGENLTAAVTRPIVKLPPPKTAASSCPDTDAEPRPLRSLSTNTTSRRTLPNRVPMPGARLNQFGNYELEASEFELVVAFPAPAPRGGNFEVWDQPNDLFTIGPLSLHLVFKDPAKWENLPVAHPDIDILDISCVSTPVVDDPAYPYRSRTTHHTTAGKRERDGGYEVRWEGATLATPGGVRLLRGKGCVDWEKEEEVRMDPRAGVAVDTVWMRTYASDSISASESASDTKTMTAKRGWELNFLVPIATALFERRETRAFRVRAEIVLQREVIRTRDDATISVSHLRREREMV